MPASLEPTLGVTNRTFCHSHFQNYWHYRIFEDVGKIGTFMGSFQQCGPETLSDYPGIDEMHKEFSNVTFVFYYDPIIDPQILACTAVKGSFYIWIYYWQVLSVQPDP